MTILHHAVNGKTDERALAALGGDPPINGGEILPPLAEEEEGGTAAEEQAGAHAPPASEQPQPFSLDQRLPVIQSALEFAKANLWMPEVGPCECPQTLNSWSHLSHRVLPL